MLYNLYITLKRENKVMFEFLDFCWKRVTVGVFLIPSELLG